MAVSVGTLIGRIVWRTDSSGLEVAKRNLGKFSRELRTIGHDVAQMGVQFSRVSLPITAAAAASVKFASDFESSFAGVRKTLHDATERELANLSKGIRALAKEIPTGTDTLNHIAEQAGQLGIAKDSILGFTRTIADLAVTTNLTVDSAATDLARFANIVQMPQSQFDRLGATIVDLGNEFASTEQEIINMAVRMAGAGEIAGLSEHQILALSNALSSVGVQSEVGGTAAQKFLIRISEAVASGGDKLETLAKTAGMSAREFAEAWEVDAAQAFNRFIQGLGEVEDPFKVLRALDFRDQRLTRAFISLARSGDLLSRSLQVGARGWEQNIALTREAEKRYETLASQAAILWHQIKDIAITLGTALIPVIKEVINAAKPMVATVAAIADVFVLLPKPVQVLVAGFVGLVAILGPLLYAAGQLIGVWSSLGVTLGILATGNTALARSFGSLTTAHARNLFAFKSFITVFMAGFGHIVAGVAAGVAAFLMLQVAIKAAIRNMQGDIDRMTESSDRLRESWTQTNKIIEEGTFSQTRKHHSELINDLDAVQTRLQQVQAEISRMRQLSAGTDIGGSIVPMAGVDASPAAASLDRLLEQEKALIAEMTALEVQVVRTEGRLESFGDTTKFVGDATKFTEEQIEEIAEKFKSLQESLETDVETAARELAEGTEIVNQALASEVATADEAAEALKRLQRQYEETISEKFLEDQKKAKDGFDQLVQSMETDSEKAHRIYREGVEKVNEALELEAVTADQAAEAVKRLDKQLEESLRTIHAFDDVFARIPGFKGFADLENIDQFAGSSESFQSLQETHLGEMWANEFTDRLNREKAIDSINDWAKQFADAAGKELEESGKGFNKVIKQIGDSLEVAGKIISERFKYDAEQAAADIAQAMEDAIIRAARFVANLLDRFISDILGTNEPTGQARRSEEVGLTLTRDREQENRDIGREIGATTGTLFGTIVGAVAGPIGAMVGGILGEAIGGALGSFLGGLFGGGSRPFSSFDLIVEDGQVLVQNLAENKRDVDQLLQIGEDVAALIEETFAAFGGELIGLPNLQFFEQDGKIEIRSNEAVIAIASTVEEAIQAMVLQAVQLAEVGGLDPKVLAAIKQAAAEAGNDLEKFNRDLSLIQKIAGIQYTDAVADAVEVTKEWIEAAVRFGLATEETIDKLDDDLDQLVDDALAPIAEFLPEVDDLSDRFNEARENVERLNAQFQKQIDLAAQDLALKEQQLAAELALGAASTLGADGIAQLQQEIEALRTLIELLQGKMIDPNLIDQAEKEAGRRRGGGGSNKKQQREDFERGLTDIITEGSGQADVILAEYRDQIAEINEQTAKLGANSDLAADAIEVLNANLREDLLSLAADISSSFGTSTFAARIEIRETRKQIDEMVEAMIAAGATADEIAQVLGEINANVFLDLASDMAEAIGDQDLIIELENLKHELEIAHYRAQIQMWHEMGVLSDAQFNKLIDLVDQYDQFIKDKIAGMGRDVKGRGGAPRDPRNPTAPDTDPDDLYDGLTPGRARASGFGPGYGPGSGSSNPVDLFQQLLDDLSPVTDLQKGLLFSEFSPLELSAQLDAAMAAFEEAVASGDRTRSSEVASLAQQVLSLGSQVFPIGGGGYRDLFTDVNEQLTNFQVSAIDKAAANAEIQRAQQIKATEEARDLLAEILDQVRNNPGRFVGVN